MTTETTFKVVTMLDGSTKRINLTYAVRLIEDGGKDSLGTGVDLEAVYLMPRSQRVIVHSYDRWEDRRHPGRVHGHSWFEADNDLIASLAREYDCEELANLLPEFVDA